MSFKSAHFTHLLLLTILMIIIMTSFNNSYAAGPYLCNVTGIGYRTDMNRLRIHCNQGRTFWAYEANANAACGTKASYEALKMYQSLATSSLLSGKKLMIYYVNQTVCNTTDNVPTEVILQN